MKSPFPGMDPYLEMWWRDVHHRLCTYAADRLASQLGSDLRARIDERLIVETDVLSRDIYPDVRVVERPTSHRPTRTHPEGGVGLAEPLVLHVGSEPAPQGFIEIIDIRNSGRVVAVIEFVSPTNKKSGPGKSAHLQKQHECIGGKVSLVEIDLVRAGGRVTIAEPYLPVDVKSTYQVSVYRAYSGQTCEVYPISLRDRLPAFRIPLRESDPDAVLDLQELIEQTYRNGRYADDIDYRKPCDPPLSADDAAWLETLLPPR